MREIAHIRATMLGRFALQQTGMKEPQMVSLAGRSGRLWTLVAYLILHRDRGIPAQELIDLLWPDGSGSNQARDLSFKPQQGAWLHGCQNYSWLRLIRKRRQNTHGNPRLPAKAEKCARYKGLHSR